MRGLYKCKQCGEIFEEPQVFYETHGFQDGFAERWSCCPYCAGDFVEIDDEDEEVEE